MTFEFDSDKSKANLLKRGIVFVEAQAIWDDERYIEAPALTSDEPRFIVIVIVIGKIGDKVWTAVYV
jgi:uncharacterized protein